MLTTESFILLADLLGILNITKQSLSRVLSHLITEGYILQQIGKYDKRQRLLSLTPKGRDLEARLTDIQCQRFAIAYSACGSNDVVGFQNVLARLLNQDTYETLSNYYPDSFE